MEKVEKIEENKKVINDFNFIISHNEVIFVDSINSKEIKAGGKYSQGYNHNTNESVQILDKDYWKSAELMRALLETDNNTWLFKKWLIFFMIFISFIGIWIVIYSSITEEESSKPIIKAEPIPINNRVSEFNSNIIEQKKEIIPITNQEKEIIPITNQAIKNDNEILLLKKEFHIESLTLDLQRIMEEKNLLTHENFELKDNIVKKDILIKDLEQKIKAYDEKANDLSQEEFLKFLGQEIYERCEKSEREGEKNSCKDLYYKFIKND